MKGIISLASLVLVSTFATATEVSIPEITSPQPSEFDIAKDAKFTTAPATTFQTGSPEAISPATIVKTEFLISDDLYFDGDILGGATGYDNFSTIGLSQYQLVDAHKNSKVTVSGKRVAKYRVYHAPQVELLAEDGSIIGTLKGKPTNLEHVTHLQSVAIIDKTTYTNGAQFEWYMKSSSTSPTQWEGSVAILMSEARATINITQAKTTDIEKAFHLLPNGELGCEFILNGIAQSLFIDIPTMITDTEDNLGFDPQLSCDLTESNKAGNIVKISYFTGSPQPFEIDKAKIFSFTGNSSQLPANYLTYPEQYVLAARQTVQLPSGKEVTSNWTEGSRFTTSTNIKLEVATPQTDTKTIDTTIDTPQSLEFVIKNIGEDNAKGALLKYTLNRYNDDAVDGEDYETVRAPYQKSIFDIEVNSTEIEVFNGTFNDNGVLYKTAEFLDFPPGATRIVKIKFMVDEHNKNYMKSFEVKACDSLYCGVAEKQTVAICLDGNCPIIPGVTSNGGKGGSSGSGGGNGTLLILLVSLLAIVRRRQNTVIS